MTKYNAIWRGGQLQNDDTAKTLSEELAAEELKESHPSDIDSNTLNKEHSVRLNASSTPNSKSRGRSKLSLSKQHRGRSKQPHGNASRTPTLSLSPSSKLGSKPRSKPRSNSASRQALKSTDILSFPAYDFLSPGVVAVNKNNLPSPPISPSISTTMEGVAIDSTPATQKCLGELIISPEYIHKECLKDLQMDKVHIVYSV